MSGTYDLSDLLEDYPSDVNEGAASPQGFGFDNEETDGENSDESEGEYDSEGLEDTAEVQQLDTSRSGQESELAEPMEDGSERLRQQGAIAAIGSGQSELLFRDATPSEDELVEEGEPRVMVGIAGEESANRSSNSQASHLADAQSSNSKKRPHHLMSGNTSESAKPFQHVADVLQSTSDLVEVLHALPIEDQEAFQEFFANYDDSLTFERLEQIDERRQQTAAYLADKANYERFLEEEGGFVKLVQENASREGTEYLNGQLHSIFTPERPLCIVTRQCPETPTSHLAFLVRVINLAAGGFFFFTSACGRKAFWTSFFPLIMPFFKAGGRALLAIPAGELSVEALEEERSWQQVIERQTSGQLRFVFVTDYDQYQSWHIKEGLVVAPGGEMVDIQMSGNFNSRGVGTEKATAPDTATAACKPGSAERMTVIRFHFEESTGRQHVQDLANYWFNLSRKRSLFYNVPSLFDFLAHRHSKTLEDLRRFKKSTLIREVLAELEHEDRRDTNERLQEAIALAAPISSTDETEFKEQIDPLTLPIQLSDTAREAIRSLVKEQKEVLHDFMGQFKREWTKEEKLKIASMNAEIIEELIEIGGEEFVTALKSLQDRREGLKSKRRSLKGSSTTIHSEPTESPRKRSKFTDKEEYTENESGDEAADDASDESDHSAAEPRRGSGNFSSSARRGPYRSHSLVLPLKALLDGENLIPPLIPEPVAYKTTSLPPIPIDATLPLSSFVTHVTANQFYETINQGRVRAQNNDRHFFADLLAAFPASLVFRLVQFFPLTSPGGGGTRRKSGCRTFGAMIDRALYQKWYDKKDELDWLQTDKMKDVPERGASRAVMKRYNGWKGALEDYGIKIVLTDEAPEHLRSHLLAGLATSPWIEKGMRCGNEGYRNEQSPELKWFALLFSSSMWDLVKEV
ncbi:hypothetical protein JCM3765_006198 [Sporobolomyces pararoseus]